jgi:hypothetical protein
MTKDEAFLMAIEALDNADYHRANEAITAIKAALEAKDEPVAYINVEQRKLEWAKYVSWDTPTVVNLPKIPLYITPPQRTWVGLIEEDLKPLCDEWRIVYGAWAEDFARAIEAKLRSKND